MADEEGIIGKVVEFIDELDDKLEAKLAEYSAEREFLPEELNQLIDTVDESLDKLADLLRPYAEGRPFKSFIDKIVERVRARKAARQEGG